MGDLCVCDMLVQSEFEGSNRGDPCKTVGTFTCGTCSYCKYMDTRKDIYLPNGMHFNPRHYSNCQTTGVVYLLLCSCSCFCVGKTTKIMAETISPYQGHTNCQSWPPIRQTRCSDSWWCMPNMVCSSIRPYTPKPLRRRLWQTSPAAGASMDIQSKCHLSAWPQWGV